MSALASMPLPELEPLPAYLENKKRRVTLDLLCRGNPEKQAEIRERCKRDFFFWADHFCFAWDDFKAGEVKKFPLVMFQFQREMCRIILDNVFRAIDDENYRWNGGADKARRMTATYSSLLVIQWLAQFHGISSIITSKTEEDVDKSDDNNTPFERLRWQIAEQPHWLLPPAFNPKPHGPHNKRKLVTFKNGGQISGMAPTGKTLRQARAMIWLADEFAFVENDQDVWDASSGTAKIRLVMSTPNGPNCLFYRLVYKKGKPTPVQFHLFELDWWKHPRNAVGLYRKPDGTLSAPFLDALWATNTAQTMAKEWLRNHSASIGGLIYHMFRASSKRKNLMPDPNIDNPIYCVWDPGGVNFAVTFLQRNRFGQLLVFQEHYLTPDDDVVQGKTLLRAMCETVKRTIETRFKGHRIRHIGDPYGTQSHQTSYQSKTEYQMIEAMFPEFRIQSYLFGVKQQSEREKKRIEVVSDLMTRDVPLDDGSMAHALLIDEEHCPLTIEAIREGYRREVDDAGEATDRIIRSHPAEDVMDTMGMGAVHAFKDMKRYQNPVSSGPASSDTRPERRRPSKNSDTKWVRTGRRNRR